MKFAPAVFVAFAAIVVTPACGQTPAPAAPDIADAPLEQAVPQSMADVSMSFAPVVREAAPAVVNVYTSRTVRQQASPFANDPFFRRFFGDRNFGMPQERVQSSLGSGVIVGEDGVIVTNNHVIRDADEFRVVLADRREFEAELVLADERTDLAVLKIDTGEEALPTLSFADTRAVEVGDLVLAIGNPFGVGQTVTNGIVSALARTDVGVSDYAFFIQTDAAINPGNSGGALVDVSGDLVGVNTAIFSRSGGSNGIGFAVPSEMVRRIVDAAVNEGRIVRPWLGLKGQSVDADIATSMGLDRPAGVLVTEVYPDSPADEAGLRRGDLVTAIDGREVFDERGLKFLAATQAPGETVVLDVATAGELRQAVLVLAPPPGATEADLILLEGRHPFSGAEIAELSPALAEELGRDPFATGVLVNRVFRRSYASRFGLRAGDILREINGEEIETADDVAQAIALLVGEDDGAVNTWRVAIERNGRRITAETRL